MTSELTIVFSHRSEPIKASLTQWNHCFDISLPPPSRHLIALVWSFVPKEERSTVKAYLQTRSVDDRLRIQSELAEMPPKGIDRIRLEIRWVHERMNEGRLPTTYTDGPGMLHPHVRKDRSIILPLQQYTPPTITSLEERLHKIVNTKHERAVPVLCPDESGLLRNGMIIPEPWLTEYQRACGR